MRLLKDVVSFLFEPTYEKEIKRSIVLVLVRVLILFFLMIGCQVLWNYMYSKFFGDFSKIVSHNHIVVQSTSFWVFALLGPVLEEMSFRYFLTSYNKTVIKIGVSFIFGYLVLMISDIFLINRIPLPQHILHLGISSIVFIAIYYLKISIKEGFWINNFKFFCWGSILLFGFVHIPQFTNEGFSVYEIARSLGSLLIGSFYLTYIRCRFGIVYSIVIHIVYNSIFLL